MLNPRPVGVKPRKMSRLTDLCDRLLERGVLVYAPGFNVVDKESY